MFQNMNQSTMGGIPQVLGYTAPSATFVPMVEREDCLQ